MNLPFKNPAISRMVSVVLLFLSVALSAQEYDKQEQVGCNQLGQYIALEKSVDGVPLFLPLFGYAQADYDTGNYDAEEGKAFIESTLRAYIKE